MKYEKLTEQIIGCAYKVFNQMGYGFLETVYEKCLIIEMSKLGIKLESQKAIEVYYDGVIVGVYIADIVVNGNIILELKSVIHLVIAHEVQLVNYLVATRIDVGLLINFAPDKVEIKRKVRNLK